jgi:hypothetical protein
MKITHCIHTRRIAAWPHRYWYSQPDAHVIPLAELIECVNEIPREKPVVLTGQGNGVSSNCKILPDAPNIKKLIVRG